MSCPCNLPVQQPWRTRNNVWSPASIIGGLILLAIGAGAAIGFRSAWFGLVILGLLGLSLVAAWIVQGLRGHRGWCLTRRGAWFGLAAPGAPLRVLYWLP